MGLMARYRSVLDQHANLFGSVYQEAELKSIFKKDNFWNIFFNVDTVVFVISCCDIELNAMTLVKLDSQNSNLSRISVILTFLYIGLYRPVNTASNNITSCNIMSQT